MVTTEGFRWSRTYFNEPGIPVPVIPTNSGIILDYEGPGATFSGTYSTEAGNTLVEDLSIFTQGSQSASLTKGTTNFRCSVTASGLALDTTRLTDGRINFDIYIPSGGASPLAASGVALELATGNLNFNNSNVYVVATGTFAEEEWLRQSVDVRQTPTETNGDGADLDDINQIKVEFRTSDGSSSIDGYKVDNMFGDFRAAGNVTGTKRYAVTFVSIYGHESNRGNASFPITADGDLVTVTGIPISPDPQVSKRFIYRDDNGDGLFKFVTSIPDNTTTSGFQDVFGDEALADSFAPELGGTDDNSPPPPMLTTAIYKNSVIGINARNRFQLDVSDPTGPIGLQEPESFPIAYRAFLDKELTALANHPLGLILEASDGKFLLTGDLATPEFRRIDPITTDIGCSGPRALDKVNFFYISLHDKGPYIVSEPVVPWFAAKNISDIWEGLDNASFADAFLVFDSRRTRMLIFLQTTPGGNYDRCLVYSWAKSITGEISGEGSGIDPLEARQGAWFEMVLPSGILPTDAAVVERSRDVPEIWISSADGYIYNLQDEDQTDWAMPGVTTTGTATGSTGSITVNDSGASFGDLTGQFLGFQDGDNQDEWRQIASNTSTSITADSNFPNSIDTGDGYKVYDPDAQEAMKFFLQTNDFPLGEKDARGRPRDLAINGKFAQVSDLTFTVQTLEDAGSEPLMSSTSTVTFSGTPADYQNIPISGSLWGFWANVTLSGQALGNHFGINSLRTRFIPGRVYAGPRKN